MTDQPHLRHPQHPLGEELAISISSKCVIAGVAAIVACYVLSLLGGWPQHATQSIIEEAATQAAAAGNPAGTEIKQAAQDLRRRRC